jgi:two-component system sensor histidine kinase CiaH
MEAMPAPTLLRSPNPPPASTHSAPSLLLGCGRQILQLGLVDLRTTILEVGKEWRQLIESRDLRFVLTVPESMLLVLADRTALERLMAILLDNAIKYTPPPGDINLHVERNGGHAVVIVRDTGIGIGEEHQGKIFERFYRVDKARSRSLGGAGIGLSIASWIVQQHGGAITVQSGASKGSAFLVEFPLQSADSRSVTSPETAVVES